MFYTVYKITNTINGKHYIGKHQTKDLDDGYFGSGKLLKRAIKKYGKDAFVKQILHVCCSEKEMDLVEKILVVPDPEISYNLCNGGQGGWSYVNKNITKEKRILYGSLGGKQLIKNLFSAGKLKSQKIKIPKKRGFPSMLGKKHTDETRNKISNTQKSRFPTKIVKLTIRQKRKLDSALILERYQNGEKAITLANEYEWKTSKGLIMFLTQMFPERKRFARKGERIMHLE